MSTIDWRADEIQRQVIATRGSLAQHDRALASLERDLQIANAAHSEYEDDVRALAAQQFELRKSPPVKVVDADGFEGWAAPPEAQREYDRLAEAIKAREAEYQRWVNARLIQTSDGVLQSSWSPRNPISVQQRIGRLRISRSLLENQLRDLEERLTPGQLLEIGGKPAPELEEHRQRMAALRERIGA